MTGVTLTPLSLTDEYSALACALDRTANDHRRQREHIAIQMQSTDDRITEQIASHLQLRTVVQDNYWRQDAVHQEEITRLRDEAVAIQMNQLIEDSEKREQEALKLKKEQEDKMTEMMAESMQMSEFIQEEFLIQETAHQEEINVLREKTMQAENKAKQ
ncbi:hypothetical protein CAPTEDRAFT_191744, partial [Capitella teleta]